METSGISFQIVNKTERNYEIHDKEILVIIRGLEA